jgi:hypothetical protein
VVPRSILSIVEGPFVPDVDEGIFVFMESVVARAVARSNLMFEEEMRLLCHGAKAPFLAMTENLKRRHE